MGKDIIDKYTYLHFASGIIAYFFKLSLVEWFVLHTIFEIIENTTMGMYIINEYITIWPGEKKYEDSLSNNIGDTIGAILGWLSAYLISCI